MELVLYWKGDIGYGALQKSAHVNIAKPLNLINLLWAQFGILGVGLTHQEH